MKPDKTNAEKNTAGKHEHPLPQEVQTNERKAAEDAHLQAEQDIEQDPDLSIHSPNDDLDEGQTSRLGEDMSTII